MGYDITGGRSKKLMSESYDNYLCHISCQYSYTNLLNKSFGFEFTTFRGRITEANRHKFIIGIDNMIENLKDNRNSQPMFYGYISNISPERFIDELTKLRKLIKDREVRYLSVG